jgi:hypothetical protein
MSDEQEQVSCVGCQKFCSPSGMGASLFDNLSLAQLSPSRNSAALGVERKMVQVADLLPNKVRGWREMARRSLTLFGVVGLALGAPCGDIVGWLRNEGLWHALSPAELAFLTADHPTEKQMINASWRSEALIVLLWALGKVEKLPAANEQRDTSLFQELLPPLQTCPPLSL